MKAGNRRGFWGGGLFLCLLFSLLMAVSFGSTKIEPALVWKVIGEKLGAGHVVGVDEADVMIIWQLRLPRVILVALVGAALAVAGAVYQGLLQNPLADPYILGVSSGSAVGAAVAIITGWGMEALGIWALPAFAFAGACIALLLVLRLAQGRFQLQVTSLILSGVVVQAFFGALLTLSLSFKPEEMQRIEFWLMGGFSLGQWEHIAVVFPFFAVGFAVSWLLSRELNLFALGERTAAHLGVAVIRTRWWLLVIASLMTSAAVSVSGVIGFVGLVIPHVMRMLFGADHRTLLPFSALAGAIFLIWADWLARMVIAPAELPIGVITAFVGAPFFAFLLKRQQKRGGI